MVSPEQSLVLLAPLAKSAGGYGICVGASAAPSAETAAFASTQDPVHVKILDAIGAARDRLNRQKRFDLPDFRPSVDYVRERNRYGMLPRKFDLTRDPVNVYATDRAYWQALGWRPRQLPAALPFPCAPISIHNSL